MKNKITKAMKRSKSVWMATAFMVMLSFGLFAQTPPHPNGGGGPGSGNTPVGGGAPIDGGLTILMLLGAAYGSKKVFNFKNKVK